MALSTPNTATIAAFAGAGLLVGYFAGKNPLGLFKKAPISKLNRPTAGARTEKELPKGDKPIQLYSFNTPNSWKVTAALEEMGLPYDYHCIHILELDQFTSGFVKINPNSKIPAMVDMDGPGGKPMSIFESGAILLYLAHKTNKFIPARDTPEYFECISWLMFQMGGFGPMTGQFGHFYKYAPDKIQYAIDRYSMEVKRMLDVLDQRLEGRHFIMGADYTIADMALWPWVHCIDAGYNAKDYICTAHGRNDHYSNVTAWVHRCKSRHASERALAVGKNRKSCMGPEKGKHVPEH